MKTIYFAGGCFWGVQKLFDGLDGVCETTVGYANGNPEIIPDYQTVRKGDTFYMETVKVDYDQRISLLSLCEVFFEVIDVTEQNRQGHDVGTQYQTGIFYSSQDDLPILQEVFDRKRKENPIFCVVLQPLLNFYKAEEYHQHYLDKDPSGYCHITPYKMAAARKKAK